MGWEQDEFCFVHFEREVPTAHLVCEVQEVVGDTGLSSREKLGLDASGNPTHRDNHGNQGSL